MSGKKPGWLTAGTATDTAPAPARAPVQPVPTPGTLSYRTTESGGSGGGTVVVSGRLRRSGTADLLVPLPSSVRAQLDDALEGGALSVAVAGLVKYALDELRRRGERLTISAS